VERFFQQTEIGLLSASPAEFRQVVEAAIGSAEPVQ
jgi:HAMP domain-containing protein